MSEQPRILLGVTGCVAAYKACELVRRLQGLGAEVRVIMTRHATEFVTPLTFEALTHERVIVEDCHDAGEPIAHISLTDWADKCVVAPCTANTLAKIACGIADDIVSTAALVAHDKLVIVPAMNVHMFEAPTTQGNIVRLRGRNVEVVDPESGYLACGYDGKGRFPEPAELAKAIMADAGIAGPSQPRMANPRRPEPESLDLAGKRVLVTAGPTLEPIDPVRFVSNRSSGKMGYSIAQAAIRRGANVTLVSGPVSITAPDGANVIRVETAQEMRDATARFFPGSDIAIFTAAVADMRPKSPSSRKLKKVADAEALSSIAMEETDDILALCGKSKREGQVVIGFAAETDDVVGHAKEKLDAKGADFIVANDVSGGAVFGEDEDEATLISKRHVLRLPKMRKTSLADKILDIACDNMF